MEINIEELKELLIDKFNNNQTLFAQELGLNRTHVNKVFNNNGKGAGATFCGAVIKYCNDNKLDYRKYVIFLEQNVNKFTKTKATRYKK